MIGQLTDCVYESTGNLAVLVGRGGIGKTRVLRAVAESSPDENARVLVLPSGVVVEPTSFELLPPDQRLIVLIDDAHERDDLAQIFSGIWRQNADASVLIATRPYRWDALRSELARSALLRDNALAVQLGDLSASAAEDLAREALGEQAHDAVVHRLARLTRDCPLVTVVGGVLIRRGQLDPAQLGHDDQVRDAILRGFRNALVADPIVVDPDTRSGVLDAVATLQPFRTDDDSFRTALSDLVGKPYDVLNKHLRSLEEAGILRRRGAALRIVPDLLGDVVLAQASYDEDTRLATGYLDRVRSATDGEVLQHLFVNVSRVDWQIRQKHQTSPSLIQALWEPLEAELRAAAIEGRQQLVRLLARVAYFQPDRMVDIARWLIDNPTDRLDNEAASTWAFLRKPTYQDVLNELPATLKAAAYNLDKLPDVLNLLWELAQRDDRPTNQFPDHPMRVLRDLAEYEIGKPAEYNNSVVDVASTWFADGQQVTPFDVLEPLLATEGSRQTYQEYTFTFQPFPLNVEAVNPIRERVIALALEETQRDDVQRAVAGVEFLSSALRYPSGMYGRPVTDEERDRWTSGFIDAIRRLGTIMSDRDLDPVVLVAIRKALHSHATYSKSDTQPAAEAVIQALRDDLADRLALIIHDGWGHLIHDREHDYATAQDKIKRRLDDAISNLAEMPDERVIALIKERLAGERLAFGPSGGHPGPLVAELIKARPSLAPQFIDLIVSGEAPALEPLLPVVLATHAELDPGSAAPQARELLVREDPTVTRAVAQALGWNRGRRPLAARERELLLEFATNADPAVRQAPAVVARRIAEEDPAGACELIAAIDFSDNRQLADEVFTCFAKPFGLSWEMLTLAQVAAIRPRLIALPDIDEHWITTLLAERSAVDPEWVIRLLQDRVTYAEGLECLGDYRPMPFTWGERLRVCEHQDFVVYLRRLHAWIAAGLDSWIRREMGAEIFEEVARPFDQSVLAVLGEALTSANPADVHAVAVIMRKAQRTFI